MSCDYLIQCLCNFMDGAPSSLVTPWPSSETMGLAEKEILRFRFFAWSHKKRIQRVMWLHGWLPVTISQYAANFDGHRPCRRGDNMFSIWQVTSWDHVFRDSCYFVLGFASTHASKLQHLAVVRLLKKNIFCF